MKTILNKLKTFLHPGEIMERVTILFLTADIFVALLLIQAIILTFTNQFKLPFILFSIAASLILSKVFFSYFKRDIKLFPVLTLPAILVIFLVALILIFFPHDTFGGRDESVYSNLAVYLVNHGSLQLPSYLNNLPSNYIEGSKEMLPAYTIWLAVQKILFGNEWLLRSNVILMVLGLSILFLVACLIGGKIVGLTTIAFFSSCLPFLWFSRETMTENMAFFLLWSLILFLLFFFKTKRLVYLFGLFIFSWLFMLTRYEGFLMQFSLALVFLIILLTTRIFPRKKIFFIIIGHILLVGITVLLFNCYFQLYTSATVPAIKYHVETDIVSFAAKETTKQNGEIKLIDKFPVFIMSMLAKYNLVLVLFSIFLLIPLIIFGKKKNIIHKIYLVSLLIIISPDFFKLINPRVTLDQPWLYRRYLFALFPMGYLSFSIFLNQFKKRKFLVIVFSGLFIINIILSKDIIFLKNNWPLINKMEEITKNISEKDFVIIRNSTLGNYYPASYLIIQRRIRSAFTSQVNPPQFFPSEKLFNGVFYDKLYLLSDKGNERYNDFKVIEKGRVDVKYSQLEPSCELSRLGEYLMVFKVSNHNFFPLSEVLNFCSQPTNEIRNFNGQLFLYELVYK